MTALVYLSDGRSTPQCGVGSGSRGSRYHSLTETWSERMMRGTRSNQMPIERRQTYRFRVERAFFHEMMVDAVTMVNYTRTLA